MMEKIKHEDYTEISEITIFNNFNDVIALCSDGVNLLTIGSQNNWNLFRMLITKHVDGVVVWSFMGKRRYDIKRRLYYNHNTLVLNVINELFHVITQNIDNVTFYE